MAVTLPGRTPFVGRERELSVLEASLEDAAHGSGCAVLIAGEPGIGKSRLLAEFVAGARRRGWVALSGRAYETEGMPPYLPFVEALRGFLRNLPDEELSYFAGAGAELAALLPELRGLPEAPSESRAFGPEVERYRLFEGLADLFLKISRSSESPGLLLALDDLHWADRSTLLALLHLARRLEGDRVLVVGTYRTVEVEPSRPIFDVLAEFSREHFAERVHVAALSLPATAQLVYGMGAGSAPEAFIEAIYRQTEGNPFYVEEIVRSLQAEGRDLSDPGLVAAGWGVPEGVRQVIGKRLARLCPEANRVLEIAAVLADGFRFEIAAAATGLGELAIADALDQALGAGVLREEGETYRFSHALIRRTIYDGLTITRRRRLHVAAVRAIEQVHARNLEPHLSALAAHSRLAGPLADPQATIDYSLRAGELANRALAYEEAEAHWEAALALMEQEGADLLARARLIERLGELLQVVGFDKYASSAEHFERALRLYRDLGAPVEAAAVHARLGLLLGAGGALNDNVRALSHLRAAEPFLKDGPPGDALLSLWSGLGLVAVWQVSTPEGLDSSRRAMDVAQSLGQEDRWVTNAVMHSYHLHALGRLEEGLALMARAWDVAHRLNNTYRAFVAASWLGGRLLELGDPLAARAWFQREVDQPRQLHAPTRRRGLQVSIAGTFASSGDLDTCLSTLATAYIRPGPDVAFWEGHWDRAQATWSRVREDAPASLNRSTQAIADHWLFRLSRLRGDDASAVGHLSDELAIGIDGPHLLFQLRASTELAISYAERGLLAEAEVHLTRCREILAGGEDWRGLGGRAALAEAVFAGAGDRIGEAEGHFTRAIAVFQRFSLPWDEAEALQLRGRMYGGAGRRHRHTAGASFESAIDLLRAHGAAQAWTEHAAALIRTSLGSSPGRAGPPAPGGLSARELEVLRLITLGRSSKEIGEELVLSVRTVERHIANIYLKTGTHGRVEAASYAQSHGLTSPTT